MLKDDTEQCQSLPSGEFVWIVKQKLFPGNEACRFKGFLSVFLRDPRRCCFRVKNKELMLARISFRIQ